MSKTDQFEADLSPDARQPPSALDGQRSYARERQAFGLIIFFAVISMVLISYVFMAFISLQSLATSMNRHIETWNAIGRTVEYVSTRTEAHAINPVELRKLQGRLRQLLDEEEQLAADIDKGLASSNLFWNLIKLSEPSVAELRELTADRTIVSHLREMSTTDADSVHSSLSYWPTVMSVAIRTHATDLLRTRLNTLEKALPRGLVVFWCLIVFIFATLIVSILLVWLLLMSPVLRNLHQTESDLRSQQQDLRLVLDNVPALIFWIDADMNMQTVNKTLQSEFAPLGDLRGRHIKEILGHDNWDRIRIFFDAALAGTIVNVDAEIQTADATRSFQINLVPEFDDEAGQARRIYVMLVNVDERLQAERSLRRSQENLSITLNSIGDGLIAIDVKSHITQFNQVAEALIGKSYQEVRGRVLSDVAQFYNPATKEIHSFSSEFSDTHLAGAESRVDLELIRDPEPNISLACSFAPILNRKGEVKGAVIIFRDVSREVQLREQTLQNEKMSAIGQLAGGIAHDFNNMLGGILAQLDLLSRQQSETLDAQSKDLIASMLRTVERASELTRKMTAFARVETLDVKPLCVDEMLVDTLQLIRETADRRIIFVTEWKLKNVHVMGNVSALQSVLINVLLNAIQAMPDGGQLTVGLRREAISDPVRFRHSFELTPGDYLVISISDTGSGIREGDVDQIFDPFFSTKKDKGGTGLGLAASYGTLADHKGAMRIESAVGVGTTFEIYLREANGAQISTPRSSGRRRQAQRPADSPTILLVDDEDVLRNTFSTYLQTKGYRVLGAADGQAATEIFRENADVIDLCVLDFNLPGLNGYQVYQNVRELRPDCPVIFVTGFSESAELDELVKEGVTLLHKPYRLRELNDAVSGILALAGE